MEQKPFTKHCYSKDQPQLVSSKLSVIHGVPGTVDGDKALSLVL